MIIIKAVIIIIFSFECAFAHGVRGRIKKGGIVVKAEYDTGEPMSYAKVEVFSPDMKLFQSGRTDRNGCFCFFPDRKGRWKVIVDDEIGHRLTVIVPVDEKMNLEFKEKRESVFLKTLIGIFFIFCFFAAFMLLKKKL